MSDHTAKRQRLTGSFSPSSPPYHLSAKPSDQTKPVVHPNTPTSPPYMSANSQPNGGSATPATAPAAEMTPPSSLHMPQQPFSQPAALAPNNTHFPSPGSTAGGPTSNVDSDGDAMMVDGAEENGEISTEHRRSDHNRQKDDLLGKGAISGDTGATGSVMFNLCQSSHPVSRPHGSQNLFELYGLSDLAKSVARTDPVSGEKINKLRKSYEGHIKALQIAGKPKAVKMEGALTGPLVFPDHEYQAQRVNNRTFDMAIDQQGGLTADFGALLDSALGGMGPGQLPQVDTSRYKAYLGTDEVLKAKGGAEGATNRPTQPTPATTAPINASRVSRPERQGSKRSYTDISFQGYGEGYTDDGYADSTNEDDGQGGIAKKRRLGFERTSHSVEVGGVRR